MISNRSKSRWIVLPLLLSFSFTTTAAEREKVTIGEETIEILTAVEAREIGFENYPDLPKDKNAAYDYIKAINQMKFPDQNDYHPADEKLWNDFVSKIRPTNYPADAFKNIFADNAAMYATLESIPANKECAYPVDARAKELVVGAYLPHLSKIRGMVRLLGARACKRWLGGEKNTAVKDLELGYQLGSSLKGNSFLIGGLVQVAGYSILTNIAGDFLLSEECDSDTTNAILIMLRKATVNLPPTATWLAGESIFGKITLKQMFRGEVTAESDPFGLMPPVITTKEPDLQRTIKAVGRIVFPDLLIARDMDVFFANQISLSKQPYPLYHRAKEREDQKPFGHSIPAGIRDWDIFSRMMLPALDRTHVAFLKCRAQLRVALSGAHLRLHQLKHKSWPGNIQDIPALSAKELSDPFTDSKPLRYKRKGKGWILYSVGPDMKDSGGENGGQENRNGTDDIAIQLDITPQIETF